MIQIAFARHGQTQWNLEKRYQGRRDIALLDSSVRLFEDLHIPQAYHNFDLYCSPLQRAQQTMKALTPKNFITVEALKECDFGDWEGKTYDEVLSCYTFEGVGYNGLDYRDHGGESTRDMQKRIFPWLRTLEKSSFIVCHKALMMAVYALAADWQMLSKPQHRVDYSKIQVFQLHQGQLFIDSLNVDFEKGVKQ